MYWRKFSLTERYAVAKISVPSVAESAFDKYVHLLKIFVLMFIDISLCLILTVAAYFFISWSVFVPYDRGFHCDDPSIRNELYQNTVRTVPLLLITLGFPLIVIFASNAISAFESSKSTSFTHFVHLHLHDIIRSTLLVYLDYVVAFFVVTLALDITKCCVGRLRPNFIAMCKPANLSICDRDPYAYVPESLCTADWKKSRNSRMSFPSGHAAATMFAWMFIVNYLKGLPNASSARPRFFRYATVAAFTVFSIYCCISRVTDFWHFPTDVLGGICFAIIFFYLTLKKYS